MDSDLVGSLFFFAFIGLFLFVPYSLFKSGKINRKTLKYGKKVRGENTNKEVKKYIDFLKEIDLLNTTPDIWGDLRETYRQVATNDDIDYKFKLDLYEQLRLKGTKGIFYPKNPKGYYNEDIEEKIRQAGEEGEKQVGHALDWLDSNRFKVFSDIRLPFKDKSQQFDTIIVGDNGVFNIETKNFVGDLSIDEEGNWYRNVGDKKTGTKNVNFQVRRHNKVLSNLLECRIPIIDLIVWTNVESVLEGLEYSQTKIIKIDQLVTYVEEYKSDEKLLEEDIEFATDTIKNNLL